MRFFLCADISSRTHLWTWRNLAIIIYDDRRAASPKYISVNKCMWSRLYYCIIFKYDFHVYFPICFTTSRSSDSQWKRSMNHTAHQCCVYTCVHVFSSELHVRVIRIIISIQLKTFIIGNWRSECWNRLII